MRRIIPLLLIAMLALTACDQVPVPISVWQPYTQGATLTRLPANGEHWVFGDSLTWQASYRAPGDGRIWRYLAGTDLTYWKTDVLGTLARRPTRVTLALGTNDAGTWDGRDGWTAADEATWSEVLAAVDPVTEVVIILPYVSNAAGAANVEQVALARTWLAAQDAVIVDWGQWAWNPGVLLDDGIHVAAGWEWLRYDVTTMMDPL
jgi:hypothetical protein